MTLIRILGAFNALALAGIVAFVMMLCGCAPAPEHYYPSKPPDLPPTQGTIDALGGLARTATSNSPAPTSHAQTIWILK